jgi:hypothetical protein
LEIADRVKRGELDYTQGERLAMFLELERLGVAKAYYPKTVYAARRREARKLGYAISDSGAVPLDVELSELLRPSLGQEDVTSPEPLVLPVRSGKHALKRCAIRRFAVRR